ncbi:MAG: methyltransferase type 11 [Desulfuromonadales bacterium GWD2_54_10]|nr:MAG: methyltransferase type 11 [Desulfuromonadales bacterium GWD2_54_10]
MHQLAMENGQRFFDAYVARLGSVNIIDVGAQDVNGSLRQICPSNASYLGLDLAKGSGVDIVLDDPYKLPFHDNTVDIIVSTSTFEHSEMFWLLFLEFIRVLKPEGLFYLNAPSQSGYHAFPVDCYRFFPDSGNALAKWGRRCGYNCIALEQYTNFGDYVCVFLKDIAYLERHPIRILDNCFEISLGSVYPDLDKFVHPKDMQGNPILYATQLGSFET